MSPSAGSDRGELALVLHSHMPYVEGFGTWPFGEEWLFEALAVSYLPLLGVCGRWADEGEEDVATIGITPVLADQLALPEVGARFLRFMHETRAEGHRLDIEGLEKAGMDEWAEALRGSARDYERAAEQFESLSSDVLAAFAQLRRQGVIELWTSSLTHAVLPLLATEPGIRLQVMGGIASHHARFAGWSGGFWLPECAFDEGLDEQLGAAGAHAFCVDQTNYAGELDQLEPIATDGGPTAVPIAWPTISLVWDPRGYPADSVYRDYHALTTNGLRPYANSGAVYDAEAGARRARDHARDFVDHVIRRLEQYRADRGRPGLLVVALDTELLGHWWYEGAKWLAAVVEEARERKLALTTLPKALTRHAPRKAMLRSSTWGVGKDLATWDSPKVAEVVWRARRGELALSAAISSHERRPHPAAERAARELVALQSND